MTDLSLQIRRNLLAAAMEIGAAAEGHALSRFRQSLAVDRKADASPVTRADRDTEAALRAGIAARFPDHGILGEEYGTDRAAAEFLWVIDPIDGTRSFITGHPLWGMLLGLMHRGRPVLGMIRMPALGEVLSGGPGLGLDLRGPGGDVPLQAVSDGHMPLDRCRLSINELPRSLSAQPEVVQRLLRTCPEARAAADCYSYLQLACGWVDAVLDYGTAPYDYLPVVPLVEAAGCRITDWQGRPLGLDSDGRVLAAPPALHDRLLPLLAD